VTSPEVDGAQLQVPVGDGDHAQGPSTASVTLVEYGDYECPHCTSVHPIIKALQQRFGGQLRFVFRNFPLTEIHQQALHAAEAAESVGAHAGEAAFWAMHDAIYERRQDSDTALSDRHLLEYAAAAGADPDVVARDLQADAQQTRVRADFKGGVRSGVNGTPTFFVNGTRFDGDWTSIEKFAQALARSGAGDAG
jgi:protein-disulfide isomerase